MAQNKEDLEKLQVVKPEETYEPRQVSLEIAQQIEIDREEFDIHQKETKEDISIFTVVEKKGFEKFQDLYGTSTNDEGEVENNFNRYSFNAFETKNCNRHRNSVELFSYNQNYFIVTKSFSHNIGSTRLQMLIYKFEPTTEQGRGSLIKLHLVEWPIVHQNACFDPSMISVIQWNQNLYYFKIKN